MLRLKNVGNSDLTIDNIRLPAGSVKKFNNTAAVQSALKNKVVINLNDNLQLDLDKNKLKEAIFKFYMNQSDKEDLKYLKDFYKFICFTNQINSNVIKLIDSVNNTQQLRQVLVNDVYDRLIDEIVGDD